MDEHSITPPPELVQQWYDEARDASLSTPKIEKMVATRAAQWGADQELEACVDWLSNARNHSLSWNEATNFSANLRADRRPKPQTLKSISLQMLGTIERDGHYIPEIIDTIRQALESIND